MARPVADTYFPTLPEVTQDEAMMTANKFNKLFRPGVPTAVKCSTRTWNIVAAQNECASPQIAKDP